MLAKKGLSMTAIFPIWSPQTLKGRWVTNSGMVARLKIAALVEWLVIIADCPSKLQSGCQQ
jgi:hypothetical protein